MYTVNCPHCHTAQNTHANIGETISCGQCHGIMTIKPLATARLANISANLINVTMFVVSLSTFLLIATSILVVGGCLFAAHT